MHIASNKVIYIATNTVMHIASIKVIHIISNKAIHIGINTIIHIGSNTVIRIGSNKLNLLKMMASLSGLPVLDIWRWLLIVRYKKTVRQDSQDSQTVKEKCHC